MNFIDELDRITSTHRKMYMPETLTDPACPTPEFSNRCKEETLRLLKRKNIMELDDIDVEELMVIFADHKGDLLDLGECMYRYFYDMAERQAEETVSYEMRDE